MVLAESSQREANRARRFVLYIDFSPLPFYYLAKLDATYYKDAGLCEMCKRGVPAEKVWV